MGNDQNKTETASEPPYLNAPSANFEGEDAPVYVLVGGILDRANVRESTPVQIQIAPGLMREYDAEFLPVFEFFQTPRKDHQVREWLEWAGGDDEFLQALIDTSSILRVDASTATAAAKSLKGLRVVPQCTPVPDSDINGNGLFEVTRSGGASLLVSVELGEHMWGERKPSDIPTFIKLVARQSKIPEDKAAWYVIGEIPILLKWGYARLEWLKTPRA
jgi:hypothetical protein